MYLHMTLMAGYQLLLITCLQCIASYLPYMKMKYIYTMIPSWTYVTQFAKARNNPAFLKTQIFTSWCSAYLKPSSVAVSSL